MISIKLIHLWFYDSKCLSWKIRTAKVSSCVIDFRSMWTQWCFTWKVSIIVNLYVRLVRKVFGNVKIKRTNWFCFFVILFQVRRAKNDNYAMGANFSASECKQCSEISEKRAEKKIIIGRCRLLGGNWTKTNIRHYNLFC